MVSVRRRAIVGNPAHISTSDIERQNLPLRMSPRRFGRLINAFSKKLENRKAAVALYVPDCNFCRVYESLRVTPATQPDLTDHSWTIGELIDAAEKPGPPERISGRSPLSVSREGALSAPRPSVLL